jgi:hypothetical protein
LAELKVKRKGYWRGPYTYTRNGKVVNVKKSWVPETTFMTDEETKTKAKEDANYFFEKAKEIENVPKNLRSR